MFSYYDNFAFVNIFSLIIILRLFEQLAVITFDS